MNEFSYDDQLYELANKLAPFNIIENKYLNKDILIKDIYEYLKKYLKKNKFEQRIIGNEIGIRGVSLKFSSILSSSIFHAYIISIKPEAEEMIKLTSIQIEVREAMELLILISLVGIQNDYNKYKEDFIKKRL